MTRQETLRFDVNTPSRAILLLIPGILREEVDAALIARSRRPFESPEDFEDRSGLREATLRRLAFEDDGDPEI